MGRPGVPLPEETPRQVWAVGVKMDEKQGGRMEFESRRVHERHTAKEGSYALLKPNCDRLGQIQDISLGGCAFEYMRFEAFGPGGEVSGPIRLDIILGDDDMFVSQLPCKIVYDRHLTDQINDAVDGVEMRRCGLKFGKLSTDQASAIRSYIHRHAGKSPDRGGSA